MPLPQLVLKGCQALLSPEPRWYSDLIWPEKNKPDKRGIHPLCALAGHGHARFEVESDTLFNRFATTIID
jgi:hypothetical protein